MLIPSPLFLHHSLLSPLSLGTELKKVLLCRRCSEAIWGITLLFCFGFTWPLIIRLAGLSSGELICFLKCRESKLTKSYLGKIYMYKSHSSRKQTSNSVNTVKGTPEGQKQQDQPGKNKNKIKRLRHYMKQPWNWLPPTHLFSFWYWLSLTLSAFCPGVHRSQARSVDQWQIQTSGGRANERAGRSCCSGPVPVLKNILKSRSLVQIRLLHPAIQRPGSKKVMGEGCTNSSLHQSSFHHFRAEERNRYYVTKITILKETNPDYSLEGLMLKLKLQGHPRQKTHWEKLMRGKMEGKRRKGQQRMKWSESITDSVDTNLSKLQR